MKPVNKPKDETERRYHSTAIDPVEIRSEGEGDDAGKIISGYAAVFNSRSSNLGGFVEVIEPGAFDDVLDDDVRGLFNHDNSLILGRSTAKTLRLSVDSKGLKYDIDAPNTQVGRDLLVSIDRGDITESSFAFRVEDDAWSEDDDGMIVRTIRKFRKLFDVSPVTYPAYSDATVALRGLDLFLESDAENYESLNELRRKQLEMIERGI